MKAALESLQAANSEHGGDKKMDGGTVIDVG